MPSRPYWRRPVCEASSSIQAIPAEAALVIGRGRHVRGVGDRADVLQLRQVVIEVVVIRGRQRVGAHVRLNGLEIGRIPRLLLMLVSREAGDLQLRFLSLLRGADEEVVLVGAGVLPESVGAVHRQTGVSEKPAGEKAGLVSDRREARSEGAAGHLRVDTALLRQVDALQVDRPAERRGAERRGSHPALDLDALERACEIRKIGEVRGHVFRIGERHSVEREVDARRSDAPQRDVRIPRAADTRLGIGVDRRRIAEKKGNVLIVIVGVDLGLVDGRLRHGRLRLRTDSGNDDALGENGTEIDLDDGAARGVDVQGVRLKACAHDAEDVPPRVRLEGEGAVHAGGERPAVVERDRGAGHRLSGRIPDDALDRRGECGDRQEKNEYCRTDECTHGSLHSFRSRDRRWPIADRRCAHLRSAICALRSDSGTQLFQESYCGGVVERVFSLPFPTPV